MISVFTQIFINLPNYVRPILNKIFNYAIDLTPSDWTEVQPYNIFRAEGSFS